MASRPVPIPEPGSSYEEFADLYNGDELETPEDLTDNQRYKKLQRLPQLGIYVDEAHHAFGKQLAEDMAADEHKTSLRLTIDTLAQNLQTAGTHVVACYNYTGTPYVQDTILPEVVYAFGLSDAIQKQYLKKADVHGYENTRSEDFVNLAIKHFCQTVRLEERYEGLLPKMAFFAATIDELQHELLPAVENTLLELGIPTDKILINVGDDKLTKNDDIREFNRLDTPGSEKQFILLVNKGREGWNCCSLFSVALYRKPKSRIFVLQATMRCLRAITTLQQTGQVYLSKENVAILDDELQQNFRIAVGDLKPQTTDRQILQIHVITPVEAVKLVRVRHLYKTVEKRLPANFRWELEENTSERRKVVMESRQNYFATQPKITTQDLTASVQKQRYTPFSLVAEIARYLHLKPLSIEQLLVSSIPGINKLVEMVNADNELLYDEIIPQLFTALYEIKEYEEKEEQEIPLVKIPEQGYYTVTAKPNLVSLMDDFPQYTGKSFHLDAYSFDSGSEHTFFQNILRDPQVEKVYFTGMLTHGQSDFFIQYIDPTEHTLRTYYPDFLVKLKGDHYIIVEVKANNMIEAPVVQAKKSFAEKIAAASNMKYFILKHSDADQGHYQMILGQDERERYVQAVIQERLSGEQ